MIDELASGVATAGSPEIERDLGTTYAELVLVILLVPGVIALALETPLYLLADRYPRRRFVVGGLVAMALATFALAVAPGPITVALAIAVLWIGDGVATSLGEATLADRAPDRARAMTWWTIFGLAGDVLAVAMLAVFAWLGLSWRAVFVAVGVVVLVWALALASRPWPAAPRPADEVPTPASPSLGLWATLVATVRQPRLMAWLLGVQLCDLLDEILVIFASLHLRDLGASVEVRSVVVGAFVAGGAVGLVVTDRLLKRFAAVRLLAASAATCIVAYALWLVAPTAAWSVGLMTLVGATAAPLWPLATAEAYAAMPGRSGALLAAGQIFTPLGLALPWALGALADHAGTWAALVVLIAQPFALLILATRYPLART